MPEAVSVAAAADKLVAMLRELDSCAVAFSAGVDSTVVAKASQLALSEKAVAVIGVGAALPEGELDEARGIARQIGIRLVERATLEIENANYQANAPDRCFHCKTELYTHVRQAADELSLATIVNGANADDIGDHRPGMRAAEYYGVRSPLLECGFGKAVVRDLAKHWGLPVWDKPAAPCLASRIAYGQQVTPQRLAMVDAAERRLRELGLRELRVRYHEGDLARLEVPAEAVALLASDEVRKSLVRDLRALGFKRVTLDLAGFESGNLNTLVPIESLAMRRQ